MLTLGVHSGRHLSQALRNNQAKPCSIRKGLGFWRHEPRVVPLSAPDGHGGGIGRCARKPAPRPGEFHQRQLADHPESTAPKSPASFLTASRPPASSRSRAAASPAAAPSTARCGSTRRPTPCQICTGCGWKSLVSGTAGAGALSGLSDVTLTNTAGRDYLRYDAGTSKWVNISKSTVMSTTTMAPGWPDAIRCYRSSIPDYMTL